MIRLFIVILLFGKLYAQFPPRAGEPGSTAIYKDSLIFTSWGISAVLNRGFQSCADTALGKTTVGTEASVLGKAGENGVVSLGDGGSIIVEFDPPIRNGAGFDFAVFENGFFYKDSLDFLELAFVEVSSDGIDFFRFPAESFTQSVFQVDTFDGLDARKIYNLAGKYTYGFGVPFDLDEIGNPSGLDKENIRFVRVVDVVGSLDSNFVSRDKHEQPINDPWPTPFPNGGFDLDAIGVIHTATVMGTNAYISNPFMLSPNPVRHNQFLQVKYNDLINILEFVDFSGRIYLLEKNSEREYRVSDELTLGLYAVRVNGVYVGKVKVE